MTYRERAVNPRSLLWILLVVLALLRLLSLGAYPLSDTTEARYGNIARLMVETGDWITPQYDPGVPFWGKPPLSTWLSAASMKLFGVNEFAARFPSFLLGLAVVGLVWFLAVRQRGRDTALAAAVALTVSPLFFVGSGTVMTDPSLLFGTTLCMVAFWQAITTPGRPGKLWGYAFFAGLAVGLLAKGPVAVVLTGLPIGGWVLWQRRWADVRQRLPWAGGLVLTALLSVPWYWMAELKTPGFLDYFLVGEHWKRFTVPGWKGDLYGNAHVQTKGTIWFYWFVCALPWSLILPVRLLEKDVRERMRKRAPRGEGWFLYLALWAAAPMVFFTPAGNILWTYVLPGLPAFALLTGEVLSAGRSAERGLPFSRALPWATAATMLVFVAAFGVVAMGLGPAERSQKELIAACRAEGETARLTYLFKLPYSAEFYSGGATTLARDLGEMEPLFRNDSVDYFAVRKGDLERLPSSVLSRVDNLGAVNRNYLLREKVTTADLAALDAPPAVKPRTGS